MIKKVHFEIKGYTNLQQYRDSFIVKIPDNILDLLVLDNNQRFLISVQGESIVLTPEVKQPNTIQELFSSWEDDGIRHKEIDWGNVKGKEER